MGTSGAYGGSGSASWADAQEAYEQAVAAGAAPSSTSSDIDPEETSPQDADVSITDLMASLAAALRGTATTPTAAPTATAPGATYPAASLRPARAASSGGYTFSRGGAGSAVSTGSGAGRAFGRQAARGASALAGAQALRAQDTAALADLGLDLNALETLPSDWARCSAIADALLGAPAHPEDAALKAATTKTMREALRSSRELSSEQLVQTFIGNLTYEHVLVQLTSQRRRHPVPAREAAATEKKIKKYIRNVLRVSGRRDRSRMSTQQLIDRASQLAEQVLAIYGRTS